MQQTEVTGLKTGVERKRVETVVKTLAALGCRGESVAEVAHDARNMVTALGLYCELLEEPGVLATPFAHYGSELRLVAAASRRLVEKLVALDANAEWAHGQRADRVLEADDHGAAGGLVTRSLLPLADGWSGRKLNVGADENEGRNATATERAVSRTMGKMVGERPIDRAKPVLEPGRWDLMPAVPIENLAMELLANHNLLAALAGTSIAVTVDVEAAAKPVRLTGEDLTRVMVNLVKNAAEAMPKGGSIHIELIEAPGVAGAADALRLSVEDSGPGIAAETGDAIFASGYSSRTQSPAREGEWPAAHRGLGLCITRSIVEAAGGRILVASRAPAGARFEIELPIRRGRH